MEIVAHKYEWKEISLPVVFETHLIEAGLVDVLKANISYWKARTEHDLHRKYDVHPLLLPPYVKRKYVWKKKPSR